MLIPLCSGSCLGRKLQIGRGRGLPAQPSAHSYRFCVTSDVLGQEGASALERVGLVPHELGWERVLSILWITAKGIFSKDHQEIRVKKGSWSGPAQTNPQLGEQNDFLNMQHNCYPFPVILRQSTLKPSNQKGPVYLFGEP